MLAPQTRSASRLALPYLVYDASRGQTTGESQPGWSLSATSQGGAVDFASRRAWMQNPDTLPEEASAGLGWRWNSVSAAVGYHEISVASGFERRPGQQTSRMVGVTFAMQIP